MDDLIYTLLIIAWVGYGIFSAVKKGKSKENQTTRPASSQSDNSIESLFDSFFKVSSPDPLNIPHPYYNYEDEQLADITEETEADEMNDYLDVVPDPTVVSKIDTAESKIDNVESSIDTYSGSDNEQSSIADEEEEYDAIKNTAIDHINPDEKEANAFVFDLRQAVIAQAVLERPYI